MRQFEYEIYLTKESKYPYAGFASEACAVSNAKIFREKFKDTSVVRTCDNQTILY